jgi:hypothetical protein
MNEAAEIGVVLSRLQILHLHQMVGDIILRKQFRGM